VLATVTVDRGFCQACGTPLFYEDLSGEHISVTLGSLDNPAAFKPVTQDGTEGRMPWFAALAAVRDHGATEQPGQFEWAAAIKASNRQHPDHDTDHWEIEPRPLD